MPEAAWRVRPVDMTEDGLTEPVLKAKRAIPWL
jgi:hypothetical protein